MTLNRPTTWIDIFVGPSENAWQIFVPSCIFFFIIQHSFTFINSFLFPSYRKLKKEDQLDWNVRCTAIAHSIIAMGTVPYFFQPSAEPIDYYAMTDLHHFYAISTGYFLWDIIVSLYYRWGLMYVVHAFASFGVMYFSNFPFLHCNGPFFLGIFEISTIFLHLQGIMGLAKVEGLAMTAVQGLFALSFLVIRVIMGYYFSATWSYAMIFELLLGPPHVYVHSRAVVIYYLLANWVLMGLQGFWMLAIIKAALGGTASDKGEEKAVQKNKPAANGTPAKRPVGRPRKEE